MKHRFKNKTVPIMMMFALAMGAMPGLADQRFEPASQIENCMPSDARCVGYVLLQAIQQLGGGFPAFKSVEFFHHDTCGSGYLITIGFGLNYDENVRKCALANSSIRERVWGIRINGKQCMDISDMDFIDACKAQAF